MSYPGFSARSQYCEALYLYHLEIITTHEEQEGLEHDGLAWRPRPYRKWEQSHKVTLVTTTWDAVRDIIADWQRYQSPWRFGKCERVERIDHIEVPARFKWTHTH